MPRTIELAEDAVVLRLTAYTRVGTLAHEFRVPYGTIRRVTAGPFLLPSRSLRWGGTAIPFTDTRHGHFWHDGVWLFLSYEDRDKTVTLEVEGLTRRGRHYAAVVLGADDPAALAAAIRERVARVAPAALIP